MAFQCGMVAVVGRPNVGKSTLVNRLVGQKVSIVSDKVQTTRRRVFGIATTPNFQIAFVDTPGVHKAHHKLGSALNEAARGSVSDVDVILVVVDSSSMPGKEDEIVAEMIRTLGAKVPVILCMNKMDLLAAADVERNYEAFTKLFSTEKIMMTSFTRDRNVDLLLGLILQYLPEGEALFPEDEFTDQSSRFLAAELVREQALIETRREVPHAFAAYVETWEEEPRLIRISMVLLVEQEGQKAILIGKQGSMLKKIGTAARLEMEKMLDKKVFLELFVKVREEWRSKPHILKELEYL